MAEKVDGKKTGNLVEKVVTVKAPLGQAAQVQILDFVAHRAARPTVRPSR
jgi:hypothetical protein